VNAWRFQSH
ncbi:hypothetical protein VCEM1626_003206C, partial [Vibrio cholerae O1 str. EM-1626]